MVIVAINDNGEPVREAKLPTSPVRIAEFFNHFDGPVQAVVERASFWYWLSDWCGQHGISLTLAHSKMVKAISYAKVKTDKVDAKTLAELLRAVVGKELAKGVWHMLTRNEKYKGFKGQPTRVAPRTYGPQPINPHA